MARISTSSPLTDAQTKSKAPAYASVPQSLAGRVLFLAELLQGKIPVSLGRQATPPNPQGLIGIDHSGPPWGCAFRHPLLTSGGCLADASGDCAGQRVVGRFSSVDSLTIPMRLYVKPFAEYAGAPYTRGFLSLRAAREAGSGSVNFTATFRRPAVTGAPMSATLSVSSTTFSRTGPTNAYWQLHPGHNELELELSTATAGVTIIIESFSIFQNVARTHL